tara:strand:- start:11 stop:226 length:216 start_codon:yes stop_codon:yes gene_type:complete
MIGFYLTVTILILMIAYAGVENTVRLFRFADLLLRYQLIQIRGYFLMRKLKKQLDIDIEYFKKISKDAEDH